MQLSCLFRNPAQDDLSATGRELGNLSWKARGELLLLCGKRNLGEPLTIELRWKPREWHHVDRRAGLDGKQGNDGSDEGDRAEDGLGAQAAVRAHAMRPFRHSAINRRSRPFRHS